MLSQTAALVKLAVLICLTVGAGHNGLEIAARLKALGSSSLLIDKEARLGGKFISLVRTISNFMDCSDNWRLRYKSLSLHDPVWANHFAYLPFPSNVSPML